MKHKTIGYMRESKYEDAEEREKAHVHVQPERAKMHSFTRKERKEERENACIWGSTGSSLGEREQKGKGTEKVEKRVINSLKRKRKEKRKRSISTLGPVLHTIYMYKRRRTTTKKKPIIIPKNPLEHHSLTYLSHPYSTVHPLPRPWATTPTPMLP